MGFRARFPFEEIVQRARSCLCGCTLPLFGDLRRAALGVLGGITRAEVVAIWVDRRRRLSQMDLALTSRGTSRLYQQKDIRTYPKNIVVATSVAF
jgi:hypothetical protein